MPPTVKENEIQVAVSETAQRPSSTAPPPADTAIKQQPVALEVPVSVNGARTVEGSDKREPFSEATKTVLVFGSGAVIRLSSSVAPGQLLFLTNERTKKEVVCQVVKSKNYRNVSGYVELEFTETVVGFWGMRFPGDRIGSGPRPTAPAAGSVSSPAASGSPVAPRPVAPIISAPAVNVAPSVLAPMPAALPPGIKNAEPRISEVKFGAPAAPVAKIPAPPIVEEPADQKLVAPVARLSSSLSSSFDPGAPLALPRAIPVVPVVAVSPAAPISAFPEFTLNPAAEKLAAPVPGPAHFDSPRASEAQASFLEPLKTPSAPPIVNARIAPAAFELKPFTPMAVPPPQTPIAIDPETEALKQQTARLQEQLSTLLFATPPVAHPAIAVQNVKSAPVVEKKELAETAAKVLEIAQGFAPSAVSAKPQEPAKSEVAPAIPLLDDEELKIPAWLEPLARNAAAPVSTQELIEREKAKCLAEQPKVEEIAADSAEAIEEHHIPELPLPTFGDTLSIDEEKSTTQSGSRSSNKGILIAAMAAGVLLFASGAWWFTRPQSDPVHAGAAPASNVQASVASLPASSSPSQPQRNAVPQPNSSAQTNPMAQTNSGSGSSSAPNTLNIVPAATSAHNPQPSSNPANGGANMTTAASIPPAAVPEKKSILGEAHFSTPKVAPHRNAQNGTEADAGIAITNEDPSESSTELLSGGLAGGNKQPVAPVAPLPVGGDVVPAKQISSVPPAYPSLAKSQHVSGNVVIDALIDATGRVTTMKVVSGPTLLHQSAMDALKQWKYKPATLDGKPTPMHLNVTIQFRLQ